jgi:hypothetical protein
MNQITGRVTRRWRPLKNALTFVARMGGNGSVTELLSNHSAFYAFRPEMEREDEGIAGALNPIRNANVRRDLSETLRRMRPIKVGAPRS